MATDTAGRDPGTTAAPRRLPDFLIIGAAKSGTSSIARCLSFHPQIFMSPVKEPEFFSHDDNYSKGIEEYAKLFEQAREDQLCGEASTAYTRSPQYPSSAERIAHHLPRVKILYLMRHPVERAYSHYVHRYTKELHPDQPITATFEEHVTTDPMCIDGSDYKRQLGQYLRFFSRDSILPLFTHEYARDPADILRQICRFLRVDEGFAFPPEALAQENVGSVYKDIVVRRRIASAIKGLPGVSAVAAALPKSVNTWIYERIRRTPVGRRVDQEMQAPPMSAAARKALLERYAETTRFVEEFAERELPAWRA